MRTFLLTCVIATSVGLVLDQRQPLSHTTVVAPKPALSSALALRGGGVVPADAYVKVRRFSCRAARAHAHTYQCVSWSDFSHQS